MKKLLSSIAFLIGSVTLVMSQTASTENHRTWVLVITPHTTQHNLDSVTAAWRQSSINLKFTKLKFTEKGLIQLKGAVYVKANDSHASGTFESDNLQSIEIKVDDRPGVSIKGK